VFNADLFDECAHVFYSISFKEKTQVILISLLEIDLILSIPLVLQNANLTIVIGSALTPNGVNIEKELCGLPSQPPLQQVGGEGGLNLPPLQFTGGEVGGEESWLIAV